MALGIVNRMELHEDFFSFVEGLKQNLAGVTNEEISEKIFVTVQIESTKKYR